MTKSDNIAIYDEKHDKKWQYDKIVYFIRLKITIVVTGILLR